MIKDEYAKLGRMKQGEIISLVCFLCVVVLWVTRDPDENVDGWAELFPVPGYMTDGMSVILIGIFLFVLPLDESGLFAIFNCCKNEKTDMSMFYYVKERKETFVKGIGISFLASSRGYPKFGLRFR